MDFKLALSKFAKGAIFGAGAALFSLDLGSFDLSNPSGYKKLGLIALMAVVAGALHGLWNIGKQLFLDPQ